MLEAREERLALEHRQRELAELRHELVGFQLDLAIVKLKRALAQKYRPDQPRVPAGNSDGGQFTNDLGRSRGPSYASLRPRTRGGLTRRIEGRDYSVTHVQALRLELTEAQARSLTREVQRHDRSWRPEPTVYEGVEGRIASNEAAAREATERLRQLGARPSVPISQGEALGQGGTQIGWHEPGARGNVRTCTESEFRTLLERVAPGAEEMPVSRFEGLWFRQPNGSIFGLRFSERYGMTYDVIRNNHPIFDNGFRVHVK
jgi:hypothetical protein